MSRGFEKLKEDAILPMRSTKNSAGYDFFVYEDVIIKKNSSIILPTFIRAFMEEDEFLSLYIRSSMGIKKGLKLSNQVGIIDSDYYNNSDNLGHIKIAIDNTSNKDVFLKKGDRVAQGIFMKYLIVDDDKQMNSRVGGIGSTDN